jgi:hypothetical protein
MNSSVYLSIHLNSNDLSNIHTYEVYTFQTVSNEKLKQNKTKTKN